MPVTVEYELTESGKQLSTVLEAMIEWGLQHRQANMMELLPVLQPVKTA
jgi:DNA-binding HxlR family transcriptional regulator